MDSIVKAVLENSELYPQKIAVATAQKSITYNELRRKILGFAASLKRQEIKKGSRIAIEAVDLPSFFAAFLGCHLAGMIAVPIERNISIYKLQNILKATKPCLVFYKNIGEKYSDFFGGVPENKIRYPKADKISSVVSTTGTTGNPVLVEHTNRSSAAAVENLINGINIKEDTVLFSNIPFDLSSGYRRVFAALCAGASAVITYKPLNEDFLLQIFKNYNVNSISLLNIDMNFILNLKNDELKKYVSSVKSVETVAGAVTSLAIRKFRSLYPSVTLYNVYGATESGCILINNTSQNSADCCIGRPACNAQIKIIDENGNEITSPEKYGYICVKGDMNMSGYYRKKTLTEKVMNNGYMTMSDIAYFDQQGYYYFVSRVGDIIDISGRKIVPLEIEKIAALYNEIEDCACAAEDDPTTGQIPVLYIKPKIKDINIDEFLNYLNNNLEEYKVPKKIIKVDKIPRTSTGKILRKMLSSAKRK